MTKNHEVNLTIKLDYIQKTPKKSPKLLDNYWTVKNTTSNNEQRTATTAFNYLIFLTFLPNITGNMQQQRATTSNNETFLTFVNSGGHGVGSSNLLAPT